MDGAQLAAERRFGLRGMLWLIAGVLILLGGVLLHNHLAWRLGSHTTRWAFSNGPAPLYAYWDIQPLVPWGRLRWLLLPLIPGFAWIAIVLLYWHRAAARTLWMFPFAAVAFAFAINCSVAMMDNGPDALWRPFGRVALEYAGDVPRVADRPLKFLADYPTLQIRRGLFTRRYVISLHGGTHPPGPVLLLWASTKAFGDSILVTSMTAIALGSLAPLTTWLLARSLGRLGGIEADRVKRMAIAAVGLHVLTPSLVLFGATCMDAAFVPFPVAAAAALFAAYRARWALLWICCAVGAGLVIAASLMLTFSTVCLAVIFGCDLLLNATGGRWRRRLAVLSISLCTVAGIYILLYRTAGFDIVASLQSAMHRNDEAVGTGYESLARYFDVSLAHVTAFVIGLGLPVAWVWLSAVTHSAVAVFRRQGDEVHRFSAAFAVSVLVLAFSTLFTLEVERVWMWMMPFALVAGASYVTRKYSDRTGLLLAAWLLLQFLQTWWMERHLWTLW